MRKAMEQINCFEKDVMAIFLKKLESPVQQELWKCACSFLNRILGLKNLDSEDTDLMQIFWESVLLQNLAFQKFQRTQEHYETLGSAVSAIMEVEGEANDN